MRVFEEATTMEVKYIDEDYDAVSRTFPATIAASPYLGRVSLKVRSMEPTPENIRLMCITVWLPLFNVPVPFICQSNLNIDKGQMIEVELELKRDGNGRSSVNHFRPTEKELEALT